MCCWVAVENDEGGDLRRRAQESGKKEREGRESDMVWWVYNRLYTCHLISGELVVLGVLH